MSGITVLSVQCEQERAEHTALGGSGVQYTQDVKSLIILEEVLCGAVQRYCIILKGVCIIYPTLIDINGLDKIINTLCSPSITHNIS